MNCVKSGELPKILQSETWYQRSIRWYEAAQEKFSDSFLSKKYLIAYIVMQYNNAADPVAYCRQIEQALKTHACTGGGNHGSPQDRVKIP